MIIFCIEATLKIFALRVEYFLNGWNIFDFIVVIFSVVDFILGLPIFKGDKEEEEDSSLS
jgi:phage-related holin